jgi:type I restriction enzyme, S subunit
LFPTRSPKDPEKFGISSSVAMIRPNTNIVDSAYLYYWTRGNAFQGAIYGIKGSAAQNYISLEMIRLLPVHFPSLKTQRKIASVLSAYDDLIENNTRRIQALEETAQALYREWFVEFRFPGHADVELVESKLGMIPQGWNVVKLGSVAKINSESIKKGREPDTIQYINISSVSTGQIDMVESMSYADAPGRAKRIVEHGDTIWAMVRPNLKSYALIIRPDRDWIASTGFAVISPRKVSYTYIYYTTTTEVFTGYLINHASGSAYPAVKTSDFKNATIILPSSDILDSFHTIVKDMVSQSALLRHENDKLREARDSLLPRLVSGEVDVSELDVR